MARGFVSPTWIPAALTLATALSVSAVTAIAHAADYQIDGAHTAVVFRVEHLGMSQTYGRFNAVAGTFKLDATPSDFNVTIKTASVDTGNQKRDDHLRGPDFFNANQFPVITFRSTGVTTTDGGYAVTGDLTLHGVTKPITFTLEKHGEGPDPWGAYRAGFSAEFSVTRSEFGMANMLEAVGDRVDLFVSFEGLRQ